MQGWGWFLLTELIAQRVRMVTDTQFAAQQSIADAVALGFSPKFIHRWQLGQIWFDAYVMVVFMITGLDSVVDCLVAVAIITQTPHDFFAWRYAKQFREDEEEDDDGGGNSFAWVS